MRRICTYARNIICLAAALLCSPAFSETLIETTDDSTESCEAILDSYDEYDFKLILVVPQVQNNTQSLGYRKYQNQTITGKMYICWLVGGGFRIAFSNLKNGKFKVNGKKVSYEGLEDATVVSTRFNYIGDNKKNKFTTPCLCFYLELEPSYALGETSEDNSFFVLLSGKGSSALKNNKSIRVANTFSGMVAGTQGCGCADYSHKSPTRKAVKKGPGEEVDDIVATYGTWTAKWKKRVDCRPSWF